MPADMPKRILRGSRLATTTVRRPTSAGRIVGAANAGKDVALAEFAQIDTQLQELVRIRDEVARQ